MGGATRELFFFVGGVSSSITSITSTPLRPTRRICAASASETTISCPAFTLRPGVRGSSDDHMSAVPGRTAAKRRATTQLAARRSLGQVRQSRYPEHRFPSIEPWPRPNSTSRRRAADPCAPPSRRGVGECARRSPRSPGAPGRHSSMSIGWSTSTQPKPEGPIVIPATISRTTEGSRSAGARPSRSWAANATAEMSTSPAWSQLAHA